MWQENIFHGNSKYSGLTFFDMSGFDSWQLCVSSIGYVRVAYVTFEHVGEFITSRGNFW